jgi:hypothetical protein
MLIEDRGGFCLQLPSFFLLFSAAKKEAKRPPGYSQEWSLSCIQGKSEVTTRQFISGRTFSDPVCSLGSDSFLARRPVAF